MPGHLPLHQQARLSAPPPVGPSGVRSFTGAREAEGTRGPRGTGPRPRSWLYHRGRTHDVSASARPWIRDGDKEETLRESRRFVWCHCVSAVLALWSGLLFLSPRACSQRGSQPAVFKYGRVCERVRAESKVLCSHIVFREVNWPYSLL